MPLAVLDALGLVTFNKLCCESEHSGAYKAGKLKSDPALLLTSQVTVVIRLFLSLSFLI